MPAAPRRVLIVGGGGREHALASRLARDPRVELIVVSPGNAGMATGNAAGKAVEEGPGIAPIRVVPAAPGATPETLARALEVDFVVIGPEGPLVDGLADRLRDGGITTFGPGRGAARLEASKAFCRDVAREAGVPMAEGAAFDDVATARRFARALGAPLVVKADGLAAGKGVAVCDSLDEALVAIEACAARFGRAGARMVVERRLQGREVSVIALCDGTRALGLPPARDHKRLGDGDVGPNTGGMGAISPPDDLPDAAVPALLEAFHLPVLRALAARGTPFRGALYAGLMLTDEGPHLLEFNVRLGDPETQAIVPRIDEPLAPLLLAAATGAVPSARSMVRVTDDVTVAVVLAAAGYPDAPCTGAPVRIDRAAWPDEAHLSWSGVAAVARAGTEDRALATAGGRIATVVGRGADITAASSQAYAAAASITFDGRQLRRDIGRSAVPAGGAGR